MKRIVLTVVFLFLSFAAYGCDASSTTTTTATTAETVYDYIDFASLMVTDPGLQLDMSDDPYYLYFYGESCSHCNTIKQEVLGIIAVLQEDTVYLVDTLSLADINPQIDVTATPTLVYIVNHHVESIITNQTPVLEKFRTLR